MSIILTLLIAPCIFYKSFSWDYSWRNEHKYRLPYPLTDNVIGRKSFLLLIANLLSSGLAFIGLFFMTRYLDTQTYGSISWSIALLAIINSVADLGFSSAHIKRVSEGNDINNCVSTYATIQSLLIISMVTLTSVSILIWTLLFDGMMSASTINLIIIFTLYYALFDLANIGIITFYGKTESIKAQIIVLANVTLRIPLVVIISLDGGSASEIAYAYVIAGVGMVIASFTLLKRDNIKWQRPTLIKSYLRFAYPLALIAFLGPLSANLDKLLIGFFGTSSQVAYYSSSQAFLGTFTVIGSSVSLLTFPIFSKMYLDGNLLGINATTRQAERYISMVGMPIVIFLFLYPTEMAIFLFGNNYAAAGESLRLLSISLMLSLLNYVYNSQILATNHPEMAAKIYSLGFIVSVISLSALVPTNSFGFKMLGLPYVGAAIANVLSTATVFLSTRIAAMRITGTKSNFRILYYSIPAIITALSLYTLSFFITPTNFLTMALFGGFTYFVFSLVLWLIGELRNSDISYLVELLSIRKMYRYICDEMGGRTTKP